ncbi:MAG TPA: hypothetical protein PK619_00235 [bacterium]|nr:hypothetical protein [bacterium]HPN81122.1 hypothetical protein [bacterium]HPW39140.1 hypothetical protein [bacterium]
MKQGKIQILGINPNSGEFYFRQPNGVIAIMNFADDNTLQVSTEEVMRLNITLEKFKDFRGDPEFSFMSLAEVKAAVAGVVAAYVEARQYSRLTGLSAFS